MQSIPFFSVAVIVYAIWYFSSPSFLGWTSPRLWRLIGVLGGPIPPPFPNGKGANRLMALLIFQVNVLLQEALASLPLMERAWWRILFCEMGEAGFQVNVWVEEDLVGPHPDFDDWSWCRFVPLPRERAWWRILFCVMGEAGLQVNGWVEEAVCVLTPIVTIDRLIHLPLSKWFEGGQGRRVP